MKKYTDEQLEKFNSEEWCELLLEQPQFAEQCDKVNGWLEFSAAQWHNLLSMQPQFSEKAKEYPGQHQREWISMKDAA